MSTLEDKTRDAKIMLGDTGELDRIAALALVYPTHSGWVVRAVDSTQAAEYDITGFLGPTARERALEYAGEKYAGVRIFDAPPK